MSSRKPPSYWTYERCKEEVLKYKTKKEFNLNSRVASNVIYKNGWTVEMFDHFLNDNEQIVGKQYNNLTVLKYLGRLPFRNSTQSGKYVECKCKCGSISKYLYNNIKNGHTKSCGCFRYENTEKYLKNSESLRKHKLYYTYFYIRNQCYNVNHKNYPKVGGMGIKVCDRWLEDGFNFFNDVGNRPSEKHRLIRIDTTKDFEPNNVKWDDECLPYNFQKKPKKEKKGRTIIYTYERCKEEALKCESKWELGVKNSKVYNKIHKNKWIELFSHMKKRYLTKEECHNEALKYKRRVDFQKQSKRFYSYSRYHGWLDDICSHMGEPLSLKKRLIYVYEFDDKHCYVGLTCDEVSRHQNHMKKGPVFKYMNKTNKVPQKKILTDYIPVHKSKKMEDKIMKKYINGGWILLNTYKAGGTGGVYKYTKSKCGEESSKYTDYKVFKKEKRGYCWAIMRNKWYDLISHMDGKAFKFRTKDDLHRISLRYSNRLEFKRKEHKHYELARKKGWLDDICSHMDLNYKKPSGWWNYERCEEESKKYKNRSEFSIHSTSAYKLSNMSGWIDMFYPILKINWTYEKMEEVSKKCKNKSEFKKKYQHGYNLCRKNKWLDNLFPKKTQSLL